MQKEEPKITTVEERFKGHRLTLLAWLNSTTGYAMHSVQIFRNFEKLGLFVGVRPVFIKETEEVHLPMDIKRAFIHRDNPEPWQLVISPADYCPRNRRKECVWTLYESSKWVPRHIKYLNRADAIITSSRFNIQGLRNSGCTKPVHLVPLGFDDSVYRPTPMQMAGPTIFGCAGNASHGRTRKGVDVIIDAFAQEFKTETDVRLHVKSFADAPPKFACDNRIQIRNGFLSEQQMAQWYSELTAFVSAARCEGFGLHQLESCASGRPVVAPLYAGLREFLTPLNSYACDFVEGPSEEAWSTGGSWAIPDEKHIRHLMRRVYKDREEARLKGIRAASDVAGFTWRESAIKTLTVLESLGAI